MKERLASQGRVNRWWISERVVFVDETPLTSTGKINKVALREKALGQTV